jgi:C-terminal processing protease CtpA/Prc
VVGERSFGKGSVQTVHDVSDPRGGPAAFKITNQYYALPPAAGEVRGRLVHKMPGADDWGVNPDLAVEMTPEQTQAAYELRRKADLIADWDEDRDPADRPNPDGLIAEGIDPQLETAILLLKARLLREAADARMAEAG